eukprot:gnl/TRDRNA2_/TRDRNA2_84807_c0_seq3.p1 gnl/TRDRNA2_/TRDRNA2_84807_c0~~gnl/TRDRNA2_/TRDRNA2_84807_c0_seq3.p1  ORF type:complete len:297 (-),score=41.33 gnl/TRDRNA2_/TRDRNA2_84807_c0_seq3:34-924(-)
MMHDWNSVYIRYCDGGTYSGRLVKAERINGTDLHFKGAFILEAVIQDLQHRHLSSFLEGTDFVIGGSSAGGLAVYLHLDFWRASLPANAKVVGLADSGFFLDWKGTAFAHSYDSDLRWGFTHMNCSAGVNDQCVSARRAAGGDISDCIFAHHTLPFIKTPIFVMQSVFDSWQLQWEEGLKHPVNYTALNAYGSELTARIKKAAEGENREHIGGFVEHCFHHCTTDSLWTQAPHIGGLVQSTAFTRWYESINGISTASAAARAGILWQHGDLPCFACGCPKGMTDPSEEEASLRILV